MKIQQRTGLLFLLLWAAQGCSVPAGPGGEAEPVQEAALDEHHGQRATAEQAGREPGAQHPGHLDVGASPPPRISADMARFIGAQIAGTGFQLSQQGRRHLHGYVSGQLAEYLTTLDHEQLVALKQATRSLGVEACLDDYRTPVPPTSQAGRRYLLANLVATLWFDFSARQQAWSCLYEEARTADADGALGRALDQILGQILERAREQADHTTGFQALTQRLEDWGSMVIAGDYHGLCVKHGSGAHVHEDFRLDSCLLRSSPSHGEGEQSMTDTITQQWQTWLEDYESNGRKQ
jgi:hypothetical protein